MSTHHLAFERLRYKLLKVLGVPFYGGFFRVQVRGADG